MVGHIAPSTPYHVALSIRGAKPRRLQRGLSGHAEAFAYSISGYDMEQAADWTSTRRTTKRLCVDKRSDFIPRILSSRLTTSILVRNSESYEPEAR